MGKYKGKQINSRRQKIRI